MLHIPHDESLATTIELSLASPMFKELGHNAHDLLGVVAFFPQGIDENNLDWLFPTLSNRTKIFDNFCILSLTYRSNGFVRMLAPLRDYLCPKDPVLSQLLRTTKDHYFHRLSVGVYPNKPNFTETQWIMSEDVNIEHLLDVFTSIDINLVSVWDACACFMEHLYWHKPRLVMLGPKIEGLPDEHPAKPQCLYRLSWLFGSVGNRVEEKQLLIDTLKIWKEQGNDFQVAEALRSISGANRWLGLHKEGILQIKEALGIYQWIENVTGQAYSWQELSRLLYNDNQLDAAEEAASKAINLYSNEGDQFLVCRCHRILGNIYFSKGEVEAAINHLWTALRIASSFNWHNQLFWGHYSLAQVFYNQNMFNDAHTHIEYTKLHVINDTYNLGCVMELQAGLLYTQSRFKEAKFEALGAVDVFEKLGAMKELDVCKAVLCQVEVAISRFPALQSDFNSKFPEIVLLPMLITYLFSSGCLLG